MIYVYALIFPIVIITFLIFTNESSNKKLLLFWGLLLSFLVGLRGPEVGIDTSAYYNLYENIIIGDSAESWMVDKLGFIFINLSLIADSFGFGAVFVTFIYALFTFYFIFSTLDKESKSKALSIALFFSSLGLFDFMHNIMRQALAVAITFYSVGYIYNKKFIRFFIVNIFAILIHKTAILFFPFYFISRLVIMPSLLVSLWLLSIPFVVFPDLSMNILMSMDFLIPSQYLGYLNSNVLLSLGWGSLGLVVIFKQLIFLFLVFAYKKNIEFTRYRVIYIMAIFSIVLGNITLNIGVSSRLVLYFSVFIILAVPLAIYSLVKKEQRIIGYMVFVIICFILYLKGLISDGHGIFPVQ